MSYTEWHSAFDSSPIDEAFSGHLTAVFSGQICQAITERRLLLPGGTPFPSPSSMTARAWWRAVYQAVMVSDTYGVEITDPSSNHDEGFCFAHNSSGGIYQLVRALGDTPGRPCNHHYLNPLSEWIEIEDLSGHADGKALPPSYVSYNTDLKLLEVTGLNRFVCPRGFDPRNPEPYATGWDSFWWGDNYASQFDLVDVFPRFDNVTPSFPEFLIMIKKVICAKDALGLIFNPGLGIPIPQSSNVKGPQFGPGLAGKTCQCGLRLDYSPTSSDITPFPASVSFDADGYAIIPGGCSHAVVNLAINSILTLK